MRVEFVFVVEYTIHREWSTEAQEQTNKHIKTREKRTCVHLINDEGDSFDSQTISNSNQSVPSIQ